MIKINGYPIDLALSEEFTAETEITEYPIEKGSFNSDHMRNMPEELTFEGVVSDTPIGAIAADPTRQVILDGATPSKDAYTRLIAMRDALEPVEIECSLGKFESMGMKSLSIPRRRDTGKALFFNVTFRRMKFVTNNRTTVKVSIPNGGGRANLGNKESQEWAKKFNLPGRRFVISFSSTMRATLLRANTYGKPPILTTTHVDRIASNGGDDFVGDKDHWEIVGDTKPDGFVDNYYGKQFTKDGKTQGVEGEPLHYAGKLIYHRFTVSNGSGAGFKGQTKPLEHELEGRPVHFDENEKAWVDDRNGDVVRKMNTRDRSTPEKVQQYNDEKWRGVTYGKNLPGGGIQQ